MNKTRKILKLTAALFALVDFDGAMRVDADTLISTFDENYFENALYASWVSPEAVLEYGPDSYSVTATGYGSNWTYIGGYGIEGAGNTHVKLDVTLESPNSAADGHLGPIVTLVDADGTRNNYAWFGQLLGNHVLTLPIASPSWVEAAGTVAGLDLNAIDHLHLQLDPGGFGSTGPYTVRWNELSLVTVVGTPGDFDDDGDVDGADFLAWQRGESPTSLSVTDLADWQSGYGTGPLAAISTVPEPGAICLAILAGISAVGRRRPSRTMA